MYQGQPEVMRHTLLPEECRLQGSLVTAPLACDRSFGLNLVRLLLELVLNGSIIMSSQHKTRFASAAVECQVALGIITYPRHGN